MRGFFEKKPLKLPKKLSDIFIGACASIIFYGYFSSSQPGPNSPLRGVLFYVGREEPDYVNLVGTDGVRYFCFVCIL